jgi:hypothetical protein
MRLDCCRTFGEREKKLGLKVHPPIPNYNAHQPNEDPVTQHLQRVSEHTRRLRLGGARGR